MRYLITGAGGQLANAFFENLNSCIEYSKNYLDITNKEQAASVIDRIKPDVVINCAAYTNVDGCETNTELADDINCTGPCNLALVCDSRNVKLVHFSTDYVFSGEQNEPYKEGAERFAISKYGESKLCGERLVSFNCSNSLIIRVSLLYSEDKGIVKWLKESINPKCIVDQISRITHVDTVVEATKFLLDNNRVGIFHVADRGPITPYGLGLYVNPTAEPVLACSLNRPARRPQYSVLDTSKIESLGFKLPHWKEKVNELIR